METQKELETWLLAYQQGNEAAFEQIYRSTASQVYGYLLSLTRDRASSEDLMQETYLRIRGGISGYVPHGKPLAWIFTISRNLAMVQFRQAALAARRQSASMDELTAADWVEDAADGIVLRNVLKTLDACDRQIVMLHAVGGLRHREIAKLMEMPLGTILWRYQRAIKNLQQQLA
ncbi:MAG: RNA polymerase sigma factor [Angelakisella sp.]|nr:RNA polymerase sigma factor [Angelakisella sp.]